MRKHSTRLLHSRCDNYVRPKRLVNVIDTMQQLAVRFTTELVRFPTQNPPGESYGECTNYVAKLLRDLRFQTQVICASGEELKKLAPSSQGLERPNVLGKWNGNAGKPSLHLNAHYDVVPPGVGWKVTKPFDPVVRGGRIYGRGTCDMKGGLASILIAISALKEADLELDGTLSVSVTADEETGGQAGLGYLVQKGYLSGTRYALIPEPTGIDTFSPAHKGDLWVQIVVKGKAAHGAIPFKGDNAFLRGARLALKLEKDLNELFLRKGPSKFPAGELQYGYPTACIGGEAGGGNKPNTVPGEFSFTIDRRVNPEERLEEAYGEIELVLKRFLEEEKYDDVEMRRLLSIPPAQTPIDSPICIAIKMVLAELLGSAPKLTLAPYFTDMHYLSDAGVHSVMFGPGRIDQAHAPDEYCRIEDILNAAKVIARLAVELLGLRS